jgi:immunoglobulin-binding protein 1
MHVVDEDVVREIYTTQIKLAIHQAIQEQEGILQELDLLSKAPPEPPSYEKAKKQVDDAREKARNIDGYSEKLDSPTIFTGPGGGPLLSKEGKPLRPFTLVDSRSRMKDEVFRPGHNLPTMTIDEYLEEEQRRGNIIEGGGFVAILLCQGNH